MHGIPRPSRPTADDVLAMLDRLGINAEHGRWSRPVQMIGELDDDVIARIARRLCLSPSRVDELRSIVERTPPPRERDGVTIWW